VDIVVKGRHTEVPERFRRHAVEKLARVEKHDHKLIRIDVELSKEHNPRLAEQSERIELTVRSKGPVIRAEACADDPYVALDKAMAKLEARLRRAADRRRVHHGGKSPVSLSSATSTLPVLPTVAAPSDDDPLAEDTGPMVIREKEHDAVPMTLDQALYEMELVGHDFYLYVDKESGRPSVVYRRRAYDYGVIRLQLQDG
jgi:ribosomal subunit interface protein